MRQKLQTEEINTVQRCSRMWWPLFNEEWNWPHKNAYRLSSGEC